MTRSKSKSEIIKRDFEPEIKDNSYKYRATVVDVVDGDTVDVEVDLGFNIKFNQRFRLHGINAPEMKGESKEKGVAAKSFLAKLLKKKKVIIRTYKDHQEKFGRYLAYIYSENDKECYNDTMVTMGHAIKFMEKIV